MKDSRGFTLLEILVSMTLMAVLVVILSMALRSGINAYNRVISLNKSFFPKAAFEGLLYRQLEAVVRPGQGDLATFFLFEGEGDKLLFVTTYGPQGIGRGGLLKVVYWLNETEEKLYYAQKVVVTRKEVSEELPDRFYDLSKEELNKKGWTVAALEGVKAIYFSYHLDSSEQEENPGKWPEKAQKRRSLPIEIGLSVDFKGDSNKDKGRDSDSRSWTVIPVGVM